MSNSSVSATGGWIDLLEVVPKNPSTTSPAEVVVTEGAANEELLGVKAPLWESIGELGLMPLRSRIAPAAETDEANVQR